jgi:pyrimidine operon attenuation protein / uracil phosphoribosyltransferase
LRNPPAWSAPDPTGPGHWLLRARVFEAGDLKRAITRIAHEIVERNHGADDVVLVGLYTRGVTVAHRLAAAIASFEGVEVPVGTLDVSFYRDDIAVRRVSPLGPTQLPGDVKDSVVVLCDDVLFTGRTIRAAMDAVVDFGRPRAVQLAVLVDRGHRELPIRADYVGKNLPTKWDEDVRVHFEEIDGDEGIEIWECVDSEERVESEERAP